LRRRRDTLASIKEFSESHKLQIEILKLERAERKAALAQQARDDEERRERLVSEWRGKIDASADYWEKN
jgi:hypothetical protein